MKGGCWGAGAGPGGVGVELDGEGTGVGTGAGMGETGKLLVMDGTATAGELVLDMATPPSTRATMPIDNEKMNMQVTELIPRDGRLPATSTSSLCICFV
jgi:hypothetical protein